MAIEREIKLVAAPDFRLPALDGLVDGASVSTSETEAPSTRPSRAGSRKSGAATSLISRSIAIADDQSLGAGQGQLLEAPLAVDPPTGRHLLPGAIGIELPRELVVAEDDLHDLRQPRFEGRIQDGRHRLHPAIKVARHQVGRAQVVLGALPVAAEAEDPRVLQEPAHNRPDADPLREAWHARPQSTQASHNQVDIGAGLRRFVQGIDDLRVDEVIDLEHDPAVGSSELAPD